MGGCFGPGCLVSFGEDLVGDNFNGSNTPSPDADPLDTCNGHGTHVAGIIAAQSNNPYGILGAAQGVTIGSFRVFGCSGDVPDDVLISAYLKAYEAGADIITASIGGPSGWPEDPWSVAVSRIVENGVPCTSSAGNDGTQGLFYSSTSSGGKKVTAIASVDNIVAPAFLSNATFSVNNGTGKDFGYTAGSPANWTNVSLPLWSVGFNPEDPANGCDPFPADTPDLSGYIVLIRRGTCTFVQKATNAVRKGAKYVMIYNNIGGSQTIEGSTPGLRAIAMATAEQGADWVSTLKAGSQVLVTMTDPDSAPKFLVNFNNTATAGRLSTYTSWGPTFEADLKPQFSTPGGLILSTYPRALGSYGVLSGTSMACPLAAAVYALIMSARNTKDPKTIENLLATTASPTYFSDGLVTVPYLAPVPQQGGGLIRAYDAAYATSLASVSGISFNDTDHFNGVQNFSITNTGTKEVSYTLSNVGALTAYTYFNRSAVQPDTFPNQVTDRHANLTFSPESFTIPPGQRKIVTVTAAEPAGLDAGRLPVYSGFIAINGSDATVLTIPYLGVLGSLHNRTVLDAEHTWLSHSRDRENNPVRQNTTFILPPAGHSNETAYFNQTDLPKLVAALGMGSPLVRADLVALSGNATTPGGANVTDVFGTKSVGLIAGFPLDYQSRGLAEAVWDGQLGDGTYAPVGEYKIVLRALRIFGDAKNESEYDSTETVPFRIRYSEGIAAAGKRK